MASDTIKSRKAEAFVVLGASPDIGAPGNP
jgi:hypothetical protein